MTNKCVQCDMAEFCEEFDLRKAKDSPCPRHKPNKKGTKEAK